MSRTPMEDLVKQCPSIYKLVVIASKRAQELNGGAPKLVETSSKKITTIALEEIQAGKVLCELPEEESGAGAKKRKRSKEPVSSNGGRDAAKKKKS